MAAPELSPIPVPLDELAGYIAKNPDKPLVDIIQPYRQYEAELRQLYAQHPGCEAIKDPQINVLPLFTEQNITVRARDVKAESQEEKDRYVMALPDEKRLPHGSPAVAESLKEFRGNFAVFSESSMVDMNWDNVVVAGSAVVNCILPVPEEYRASKRLLREYYHEKFCPASDVDLFLYGLSEEEAVEKIKEIESCIKDSILTETTTVRTKHAITICSQYPTRHVQIVLRIYNSVSEILTGFDIDCSGAAYDGKQVYVTPRALQSYISQINHIDLSRRSPSYENRLSKYSHRNFEVYWPELDRSRIDPTIFERSFMRTLGLARLLVLERLPTTASRDAYSAKRREERGRPALNRQYFRNTMWGNIKEKHEDEVADWVDQEEVSNYHTFTIPYGPKFHAKKIEKLCYTRDLLLNAEWNQPKDRDVYLHRHPAFFGRVEDVIHDCCGFCPTPQTDEEKEIAEKESQIYVSGEIVFIKDNPGRQQIGSFNPLTEDDWTEMAYVGNTARLCQDIVDGNLEHVQDWLAQEGADPNSRDYTGRTPLHLAVLSSTPEIVKALVESGARLVARLADGRTALHLAAERGHVEIVKILLDKSNANEEEEAEKQDQRRKAKGAENSQASATDEKENATKKVESENSEDEDEDSEDFEELDDDEDSEDQSIATGSFVKVKGNEAAHEDLVPDEQEDEPDFYDVNVVAWDVPSSALHLAIVSGHEDVVQVLCEEYGADALLPVKFMGHNKQPTAAILTLALTLSLPLDKAKSMAKLLLGLGAQCVQADMNGVTAFQEIVEANAAALLDTLFELDKPGCQNAIIHVAVSNPRATTPLLAAVANGDTRSVLKLLDAGAVPQIDFDAWLKGAKQSNFERQLSTFENNQRTFHNNCEQPLIVALKSAEPGNALELLKHGADPNTITQSSWRILQDNWYRNYNTGETALDVLRTQLKALRKYEGEVSNLKKPRAALDGAEDFLKHYKEDSWRHWMVTENIKWLRKNHQDKLDSYHRQKAKAESVQGTAEKKAAIAELVETLEEIEKFLLKKGAKTWDDLHPELKNTNQRYHNTRTEEHEKSTKYEYGFSFKGVKDNTAIRNAAYVDLFEAAWAGDLDTIKLLTLSSWDDAKTEPPLQIAVEEKENNNPFSLAYLRGHFDVAKAILEIAQAQYVPAEQENVRFKMKQENPDEYSDDYDSEAESDGDDNDLEIYREIVDDKFTIENIGQISIQVQSRVKPTTLMSYHCPVFELKDGKLFKTGNTSLFRNAINHNDQKSLKQLLSLAEHFSQQNLDPEEESSRFYSLPREDFFHAIANGRTEILAELIKRTGAGLPLEEMVKQSGVEMKTKPRYYQGLTVYGKKRTDWAQQGRNIVSGSTGTSASPLTHAALEQSIESVEWFLSDAPLRHYLEFAKSKAAREDPRLKHLSQAPGGFEKAITTWLNAQNDHVIHAAVLGGSKGDTSVKLLEYLIQACPASVTTKSKDGYTPLFLACLLGRLNHVRILIANGADQSTKDASWSNILHAALKHKPSAAHLESFLALLDPVIIPTLVKHRASLATANGQTPLHMWISPKIETGYRSWQYNQHHREYKTPEKRLAVLEVLLRASGGSELDLLDATGDTPLHTLIGRRGDPTVIKAIIDASESLLLRESAVGRTPAEVARDAYVASRIAEPPSYRNVSDDPVSGLVSKAPEEFLSEARAKSRAAMWGRKKGADVKKDRVEEIWGVVKGYLENGDGDATKRRLVSLHEANDVARRLGAQHQGERYGVQAKKDDDEETKKYDVVAARGGLEYLAWKGEGIEEKEEEEEIGHVCGVDCDSDSD